MYSVAKQNKKQSVNDISGLNFAQETSEEHWVKKWVQQDLHIIAYTKWGAHI